MMVKECQQDKLSRITTNMMACFLLGKTCVVAMLSNAGRACAGSNARDLKSQPEVPMKTSLFGGAPVGAMA